MNRYPAFEKNIQKLLCKKKFLIILKVLRKGENEKLISENVWNITNLVCETVKSDCLLKNKDDVERCQDILVFLVDKGNPKEVLIALLEHADTFKDNAFFCLLLEPLQIILKKTPGKRGKSLQWVLSTLNAHMKTLKKPKDLDLQDEEKLFLDADPAVQDAAYVLKNYLKFIQFFVDEVSFENLKTKEIHYFDRVFNQQEIMQRYILKLFHHPLLYHDLTMIKTKSESMIQVICKNFINCLSKICRNVFNLFELDSSETQTIKTVDTGDDYEDDDRCISLLAFSNLSFLIYVENMTLNFQPFVYSHCFIFFRILKYSLSLLKETENLVLYKGLQLSDVLLSRLNDFELTYNYVELDLVIEFPKILFDVTIFSQFEAHRHSALKLIKTFISKCDYKARYHVILKMLSVVKHSGAQGVLISLYKDNLHNELGSKKFREIFLGKNLTLFIKNIFVLTEGIETDILENSDKILTALNLLRYLFVRDKKPDNVTGIWDLTDYISNKFIKPLIGAIDMSRAHYKEAMKGADSSKKKKDSLNTTVTVNSEILPNIPLSFQKDVLKAALTTFDCIEYVLSLVKDLMLE